MSLFLATGHGRSGTLWLSMFFTGVGAPTLHEVQYAPHRSGPLKVPEVSWLAVPYIDTLLPPVRLLRVVRDPYDAVISGMQLDFQREPRGTPFDRFLSEHRPDIVAPADKLTRIIRWVAMWDAPMDEVAHTVIRPDADPLDRLGEIVEYVTDTPAEHDRMSRVRAALGSKVNTKRRRDVPMTRDDIDQHPEGWRIRERAARFGYV